MTKEEWIKIYNAKDGTWDKDDLIDKAYEIITSPIKTNYDLINRLQEEIESLKHRKTELQIRNQELQHEKSEAIKEFAERLKKELQLDDDCNYDCENCNYECKEYVPLVDNLVKEMTEVEE